MIQKKLNNPPEKRNKGDIENHINLQHEQITHKISWLTQRQSSQPERVLRQHNHIKNTNNIYQPSQINHKGLPHKQINLCLQSNTNQYATVKNILERKNSNISSEICSQKGSCQKKQKLTIVSKRNSLRKISDFISFPSGQIKTQTVRSYKQPLNQNSHQEERQWGNIDKIQHEMNEKMMENNEQKKRKIRISVKRDNQKENK